MTIDIIGNGRMAKAIQHYIAVLDIPVSLYLDRPEESLKHTDFLIGTLPGGIGERSLELALKYGLDLIDLADLETDFYLEHQAAIEEKGIRVICGAGFCPGLVNFILGHAFKQFDKIENLVVKAGSLSPKAHFFPFLWCFEDMVLEFVNPSEQIVNGRKVSFPAFAGYETDSLFDIPYESYLCQSGFENLLDNSPVPIHNFTYRNLRPIGFMHFFQFMQGYGFFEEENLLQTKKTVESKLTYNISCAIITVAGETGKKDWLISCAATADEQLNSMQKITALFCVAVLKLLLNKDNSIAYTGLVFCEELGAKPSVFEDIITFLKKHDITIVENYTKQ